MPAYSAQVTAPAAFAAADAPSFTIPFQPKSIVIVNEDTTLANYVEYSFDGVTAHGRLTPTVLAAIRSEQRVLLLWVRRGAGAPVVRIMAEG